MYTNKPDYDSSWVYAEGKNVEHSISFTHGIGKIPALVQCFFSPQATMKFATPLTYFWYDNDEFNPTSIRFNDKTIKLEMRRNISRIFAKWNASLNGWTYFQKGYFRCVAYKSSSNFD